MHRLPVALFVLLISACKADPVIWGEPVVGGGPNSPPDAIARTSIVDPAMCPASMRVASAGNYSYAAWWRIKSDSSSSLIFARANQGESWDNPIVADSTDHSNRGCARPAPAIAVDTASGYAYVAYFLEPSAGPGIFFAHSMDRGATLHAPVPIVFGKNPSRVSVAARGDRIAVAYEDPNAQQPLIGVALSKTMGHLFESRVEATLESGRALQPVVRIGADSLRLWWSEYPVSSSVSATRPAYRAGQWR